MRIAAPLDIHRELDPDNSWHDLNFAADCDASEFAGDGLSLQWAGAALTWPLICLPAEHEFLEKAVRPDGLVRLLLSRYVAQRQMMALLSYESARPMFIFTVFGNARHNQAFQVSTLFSAGDWE